MAAKNIIILEKLGMDYGAASVLRGVSFKQKAGECVGLAGLNGAGKTTLIKALLGLRNFQAGNIRMFGAAPGDKSIKQKTAYLPERFDPPGILTGIEFLEMSARLYGRKLDKGEALERAQALGLSVQDLARRASDYSKGMRQKLGLLCVLMSGAGLLILDEPMSGLDPRARLQVKEALKSHKKQGGSLFFSSHILNDMAEFCDRIVVLDEGHFKFEGSVRDLYKAAGQNKVQENLESAFLHVIENKRAA